MRRILAGLGLLPPRDFALEMRHAVVLSLVSFALHFAWENVQCPLLYVHGSYDASWLGMVRATSGDVLLTWSIYASVAVVSGRWRWDAEPWSARAWAVLVAAAIVLGIAVEVQALATGRWTYTPSMPVSPGLGVGLVPVAQLLILTPGSIRLAARFARGPRTVSARR